MGKEKLTSTKTLEELFKKETKWESIKWFPYRIWSKIEDLWLDTIAFFQRGKRGYADKDTWDFDYYLSGVILGGLKMLKKYQTGYPPSITEEEWNRIMCEMIEGFENSVTCESIEEFSKEKLDKSLQLFAKYFKDLWD